MSRMVLLSSVVIYIESTPDESSIKISSVARFPRAGDKDGELERKTDTTARNMPVRISAKNASREKTKPFLPQYQPSILLKKGCL